MVFEASAFRCFLTIFLLSYRKLLWLKDKVHAKCSIYVPFLWTLTATKLTIRNPRRHTKLLSKRAPLQFAVCGAWQGVYLVKRAGDFVGGEVFGAVALQCVRVEV